MKKLAKYLLLTLLVLLLAGWLLLTLFDANRLKQPVLAWLNEHTDLDASIGDITFNPLHPYTLLAEDVRLGDWFNARQVYVQLATLSPLSGQTRIATLDLIDAKLLLDDAIALQLPDNLANIHVAEFTTKNLSLDWQGWQAKGTDLTLHDWQPRLDGNWQWGADVNISGQARQLTQPNLEMAQLTFHGQVRQQQLQLTEIKSRLFDGIFESNVVVNWPEQQLTLNSPQFSHNQLQFEQLPEPASGWSLQINKAQLEKVSITSPYLTSNNISGELRYFEWAAGQLPDASGQWQADEAVLDWLRLDKHQGELLSSQKQLSLNINGQAYEGSVTSELRWHPEQGRLDIDSLAMQNNKFVWQADMKWPLPEVRLHKLDISNGELLSLDPNLPLSVTGGELFVNDIAWSAGQWRPLSKQARAEANWNEIAFNSLIARQGKAKAKLDDTHLWLTELSSDALEGQVTLSGKLGLYPPYAIDAELKGQELALRPVSRWLKADRNFSGKVEINAELKGEIQNRKTWQGQVALSGQEVFVEKLGLDNWLSQRLREDYAQVKSVDAQLAALDLNQGDSFIYQLELKGPINNGRWRLDGSALQSVRYLLALRGEVDLAGGWQLEVGAVNDKGCRELAIELSESWRAPKLTIHQPKLVSPCKPWYQGGVPYPKSGLSGSILEGVRALQMGEEE
ncbi:AsmA-like C-terminal region-containing protein [Oceanisphaera sp. IT1-181]|uniref:AsmA-like C-terminal region-containing protein n=1 Tax=Oceanisphaera sp. IT1-181 TaxID=3081199 RepID=UPI0029CAAB65|nr:AsmA-like C-terminal region-containing protein [Oceanisphaera sp. IT1-181]